jgi:hypothetical protein
MIPPARPLYFRILRVRHIRPGWLASLVIFEGSCFVGILLSFAELTDPWAILAVPAAVAVMLKFNDAVAGALKRPLAVAQLNTPGPRRSTAIGRSPVPGPSRLTTSFSTDDALADPEARPGGEVARGIAPVPGSGRSHARRPRPGIGPAAETEPAIPDEPGPEQGLIDQRSDPQGPDSEGPRPGPGTNPGHFTI